MRGIIGHMQWRVLFLMLVVTLGVLTPLRVLRAETSDITKAEQARLEAELKQVEAEIAAETKKLQGQQAQSASFQRDINILTTEINRAKLNIKAKQIEIARLGDDITKKVGTINVLQSRLTRGQMSLAELLRQARELDDETLAEVVLARQNLNTLFADLGAFEQLQEALHVSFGQVRTVKATTEKEKGALEVRRAAEQDAERAIAVQKKIIEQKEAEKQALLSASKNQEASYKQVIAAKEAKKAQIRSALFRLRGATAISFGEAYGYASRLQRLTGVRAAFVLAIITQESNLGQNVGNCYLTNPTTGAGIRVSTGAVQDRVMNPVRDVPVFLRITKALGLDSSATLVSCPFTTGWGGAMGPSQFIASTWQGYETRIASTLGINTPNPWQPEHAFTATALFLKDLGAAQGGYTAERTAALRYYAGGNWSLPQNAFYGNSVMQIAEQYQQQINILQGA